MGFVLATAVLVVVSPWLVQSSVAIADVTGLGTGFVGTALLAVVTSLPELVTTLAAARLGAYDLAVGNLFGSNMFNMFILGLTDVFFTQGRFLAAIHPAFALAGLLALLLTGLGLIVRGGDWFLDGAVALAEATGMPRFLIGATVVSLATTLPGNFEFSTLAIRKLKISIAGTYMAREAACAR